MINKSKAVNKATNKAINKAKIARSFSRSASTYDSVAHFQRDTGNHLLAITPQHNKRQAVCIDLGCGTGYCFHKLIDLFPIYHHIGVDLAEGMLQFTRQKNHHLQTQAHHLVCADAEELPFRNTSIDLIFSNMALQWCNNLPQLFAELYRILNTNGVIALSTLGPETLTELKQAWAQVDNLVHVNTFSHHEQWRNTILDAGLTIEIEQHQQSILRYHNVQSLLKELKQLGAHNINDGQRQSLTGRKRLSQLLKAYQEFKIDNYYPATYDTYFYILKKAL